MQPCAGRPVHVCYHDRRPCRSVQASGKRRGAVGRRGELAHL